MKKVTVIFSETNKQKEYDIVIGNNLLERMSEFIPFEKYSKVFVITDENVAPHFLDKVLINIPIEKYSVIIAPGEKAKDIETVQILWKAMYTAKCDRKSLVINLGGGVIGDIGGFVASTYMRGVDFINIPTTILAQVDESVGGKTGFDFASIKNIIGTFAQPSAVVIDTQTITTLPKREYISGFAEIIKHGLIKDNAYLTQVTAKHPLQFTPEEMINILARSCEIKADVVQRDEKESGERRLLNFGHTIGHAIEAIRLDSDKLLLHGEAVSIGIVAEAKISQLMGFITENDFMVVESSLQQTGLPTRVEKIALAKLKKKMLADKKNEKGVVKFVLLEEIGKAVYGKEVSETIIDQALEYIMP